MKFLVIVGDGMGDRPVEGLGGKTPLMVARTPHMDRLAREGLVGLAKTIPEGMSPGSDVANMALMGWDPARYHTGRAPIEAAAMGITLEEGELAFRCNLVTLAHEGPRVRMEDYSAGHIPTPVAHELIAALNQALGSREISFHPGVSYRHVLTWKDAPRDLPSFPPHDYTGQDVTDKLEAMGPAAELVRRSWKVLEGHPANARRLSEGRRPANSIWLWGQGPAPALPSLEKLGLKGVVVAAVDLIRGLGVLGGLKPIEVPGATGLIDTNYEGKVGAALKGLKEGNFAFVHVEAPDEASHSRDLEQKIRAIELFDERVVGPVVEGAQAMGPVRVLLATDHYTPLSVGTHTTEPVPFVIWDSRRPTNSGVEGFNEAAGAATGLEVMGHELMEMTVRG